MKEKTISTSKNAKLAGPGPYPEMRAGFRVNLLSNPNFFGTVTKSPFKPVFPMAGNTYYEELVCVGYHPQKQRLEGVVHIYQQTGYGMDQCGPGTPEYVRFFLSYDNGTSWEDMGITAFQAYDIPESAEKKGHLEYAVSLPVSPESKFCLPWLHPDTLVRVRAILSWNDQPVADAPGFSPVWGNVKEATVQIEPESFIYIKDILTAASQKEIQSLEASIDPGSTVAMMKKELGAAELAQLYKDTDVPVHRFAFREIAAFADGMVSSSADSYLTRIKGVKIPENIIELLNPNSDGNTTYEELKCIGLDPNVPDQLVGIIQIKKATGYSGQVCSSKGSAEYVTFWADFDGNGTFGTCLGTADVQVYDIPSIKSDGIFYAVSLPVDLSKYRPKCSAPKIVRIRAILSWNQAVPCTCPGCVPVWGNRKETLINIGPASASPMQTATIAILGGIPTSMIDATGLTKPGAKFSSNNIDADSLGRQCPFGGLVTVQGAPVAGMRYMVEVSSDGKNWNPVTSDIWTTDQNGFMHQHSADSTTHTFEYLDFTDNITCLLANWYTSGDEQWQVRLTVYNASGTAPASGYGPDTRTIQLDNSVPYASLTITSGTGDCGKVPVGTAISGEFTVYDAYSGSFSLGVDPVTINGIPVPLNPVNPNYGTPETPTPLEEPWSLSTDGMSPCGYNIQLYVVNRAIMNSESDNNANAAFVGFCLSKPSS